MTYHRRESIASHQFGRRPGRAVGDGAVGGGVLADPEALAVGVDGLQVDGAGGAGGDEAEGAWGRLAGDDGFGGGEEGEEGGEDKGGVHGFAFVFVEGGLSLMIVLSPFRWTRK